MDNKPSRCRECQSEVSSDELPKHFRMEHPFSYSMLQGQLRSFDQEHGLEPEDELEEEESTYTSRYAHTRRLRMVEK